jgi:hypothetical protein
MTFLDAYGNGFFCLVIVSSPGSPSRMVFFALFVFAL